MGTKKITELQLISSVTDDLNFPGDNGIQTYRATALQIKNYILAAGNVGTTQIADNAVTTAKIADSNVTTAKINDGAITQAKLDSGVIGSFVPTGAVLAWAYTTAPTGYLACDGSAVSRTTYATLFALIGVTHGSGNGTTTFNVPDYRGRFLRGVDGSAGLDPDKASRTAMATGGNTGNNVGSVQADQYKSHTHAKILAPQPAGSGDGTPQSSQSLETTRGTTNAASGGNETRPVNAYVNYIIKT